jgi:4'-phosphopantetheinyl transferase
LPSRRLRSPSRIDNPCATRVALPAFGIAWFEQVSADAPVENDWLSAAEQDQLAAFKIAKRRNDWRLGRWTAKLAIAHTLSLPHSELASIEIRPAPGGAPHACLRNALLPLAISISHRDGRAICAISESGAAIGCDLEVIEPRTDAFIADYLTESEQALVNSLPADQRFAAVAILWSAKESALKALGEGLRMDTRSVMVTQYSLDTIESFCRTPTSPADAWNELNVLCTATRETFTGAWQKRDNLIRTFVIASSQTRR